MRFRAFRVLPLLLLAVLAAAPGAGAIEAPAQWSVLAPSDSNLSPAVVNGDAVVDRARRRVVVLGYTNLHTGVWTMPLDGPAVWKRVTAAGQPFQTLFGSSAIFDPVGDRMILVGGTRDGGYLPGVWQLSFAGTPAWSELAVTGPSPPQRNESAAIYDPVRRRMIVFAGNVQTPGASDVWALALDGPPAWQQLLALGTAPAARHRHSAVYDSRRDRMLVVGGTRRVAGFPYELPSNDVWELPLGGAPVWDSLAIGATRPAPRSEMIAVYDSLHDRIELHGGYHNGGPPTFGDHWWLNLTGTPQWVESSVAGGPGLVGRHASAIDPECSRFFVFGGNRSLEYPRDVWALGTDAPRSWVRLSPELSPDRPPGTFSPMVLLDRRSLIVFPGLTSYYGNATGGFWTFDLDARAWDLVRPDATLYPVCVDTAGRRLVSFTYTYSYPVEKIGTFWTLPLDGSAPWTAQAIGGLLPEMRERADFLYDAPRNRVLLYGGTTYPIPGHSSLARHEVLAFSLATREWSVFAPEMAAFGSGHAVLDGGRDRLVFVPSGGGALWQLPLDGSAPWQPLDWLVGRTPTDVSGSWAPLFGSMLYVDAARDRIVTSTRGDSLWVLPLGHPGDWAPLANAGPSPGGDAWLAALEPESDRGIAFGGTVTSNGVWQVAFDASVPVAIALASVHATSEAVELEWSAAGGNVLVDVERREAGAGWRVLGQAVPGAGLFRWRDATVAPGGRYEYRLAWDEAGGRSASEAVAVEVPRASALALLGVFPNPAGATPAVRFSLATPGPVELEVFDAAGRRVLARRFATLAAGTHTFALAELEAAGPGVRFLRLAAGGTTFRSPFAIVR